MRHGIKILLLLLATASPLLAAEQAQPIRIEADRVQMDDARGESRYEGNVRLTQGGVTIKADKVTLSNPQSGARRMVIKGSPAHFKRKHEDGRELLGSALTIEYDSEGEILLLKEQAQLDDGKRSFSSNLIRYNNRTDQIEAGQADNQDRVTIIIQPDQTEEP